ncbi:H-NS histone family protein [Photobacterium damselae subsp. damselae]|uniref:H-NS histone family protein n=1 Tax=Photobacterium damselae subsp. damselae TaxID=85581 RepID=A0A850QVP3_PHODD|nr:H-NS histone family protein [Photobacterium damselae subsp. damselae]
MPNSVVDSSAPSLADQMKKVLTNIRTLRTFVRVLTLDEMLEIESKLSQVIGEFREEAEKAAKEEEERQDKIAQYIEMLKQDGIDLDELSMIAGSADTTPKKKRAPKPPKYRFIDNGEEKTWTGQGRTPSALAALLEQGHDIDEFLIK